MGLLGCVSCLFAIAAADALHGARGQNMTLNRQTSRRFRIGRCALQPPLTPLLSLRWRHTNGTATTTGSRPPPPRSPPSSIPRYGSARTHAVSIRPPLSPSSLHTSSLTQRSGSSCPAAVPIPRLSATLAASRQPVGPATAWYVVTDHSRHQHTGSISRRVCRYSPSAAAIERGLNGCASPNPAPLMRQAVMDRV